MVKAEVFERGGEVWPDCLRLWEIKRCSGLIFCFVLKVKKVT